MDVTGNGVQVRVRRVRSALVGVLVSTTLLVTGVPAGAEAPLGDLVWFPPGLEESFRGSGSMDAFLEQEAGTAPVDILEHLTAAARGDESVGARIVQAVRLASPAIAEEAARTIAARDLGPVRGLGSLGQGFVVSYDNVETPGFEDLPPLNMHEGYRVVGRDLVVFVTHDPEDPAVPQGLLDHVAEHAARFPGSSAPGPGGSRSLPALLAIVLGGVGTLAVVAAVGGLTRRRRRPPPAATTVGPVSRPWVA